MTPHETLGVSKTAGMDEIRAAYKRMAMKFHPDRSGGNVTKFQEIRKAYEKLINAGPCRSCGGTGECKSTHRGIVKRTPCPVCWPTR